MKVQSFVMLAALLCGTIPAMAADPISYLERDLSNTTTLLRINDGGECESCEMDGGCGCRPNRAWYGGIEATFLKADLGGEVFDNNGQTIDLDRDFEGAPRVWIGAENSCGWGVVARYWDFDSEAAFSNLVIDEDTDAVFGAIASASLEAETIDLEITRHTCFNGWDVMASAGLRHGRVAHSLASVQYDFVDDTTADSSTILVDRRFDGTGITGGLSGSRPLRCNSCVSAFWNVRGSVLWGDSRVEAANIDSDVADGDIDLDVNTFAGRDADALVIGEIQIGLETRRRLECVNAEVFVRGVLEYQIWDLNAESLVDLDQGFDVDILAEDEMKLFGAGFSMGIAR